MRVLKTSYFGYDCDGFFIVLASQNGSQIYRFSNFIRKRQFCKNRAPRQNEIAIFQVPRLQNPLKINTKTLSKKSIKKNPKYGLLHPFWLSKTSQNYRF